MLIIDRIGDGIAVIEDDSGHYEVPASMLDGGVREGDVVVLRDGKYFADKDASEKRRSEIIKLQNGLWE